MTSNFFFYFCFWVGGREGGGDTKEKKKQMGELLTGSDLDAVESNRFTQVVLNSCAVELVP